MCPNFEKYTKTITFSFCSDSEFTCSTGYCVDMNLRCDGRTQCTKGFYPVIHDLEIFISKL